MIIFNHAKREADLPSWFDSKDVQEARRQIIAFLALPHRERSQTDPPPVWKLPIPEEVRFALLERSGGLCAFCEMPGDGIAPYRWRPPAYATPEEERDDWRIAYLWRAFQWANFFPICAACRPRDPSFFPLGGSQEPNPVISPSQRTLAEPERGEEPMLYKPKLNRAGSAGGSNS